MEFLKVVMFRERQNPWQLLRLYFLLRERGGGCFVSRAGEQRVEQLGNGNAFLTVLQGRFNPEFMGEGSQRHGHTKPCSKPRLYIWRSRSVHCC